MTNMKMNTVILLSLAACTGMLACPGAWATAVCQEQSYHLKTACPHPLSLASPADERVYLRFQAGWASKYECEGLNLWDGSLCMFVPEIQYKEWVGKIWYGVSTDHRNHAELKYRLDYVRELGNWTVMPWYEHSFVFPGDKGIPRPGLKTTYHFPTAGLAARTCTGSITTIRSAVIMPYLRGCMKK